MRDEVATLGFSTTVIGRSLRDVAREILDIAQGGLRRRAYRDGQGRDETVYLAPLFELVDRGQTTAERLLERYHGAWGGNVDPVFVECAY